MYAVLLFLLSACTALDVQNTRRSAYDQYLQDHVQMERLFVRLKETANAKFLEITPEVTQLQSKLVPGFEIVPTSEQSIFIVSLEMPEWARFNIEDFKFLWGDEKSKKVKEISDPHLLRTYFPFSVPHDRVFQVEFLKPTTRPATVRVQTPQGQFIFHTTAS